MFIALEQKHFKNIFLLINNANLKIVKGIKYNEKRKTNF